MFRPRALKAQSLTVAAPQELVFQVVASAGDVVEKRDENSKIVDFTTEVGNKTVVTRELVELEPPNRISYEWLEGPLPFVEETIEVVSLGKKETELRYRGRYSTKKGLTSCIAGYVWVKRIFDRLVMEHLQDAKRIAEERLERSKLFD